MTATASNATAFPPLAGYLTTVEVERWILYRFASDNVGPSADFPNKLNSPVIIIIILLLTMQTLE